MKYFAKFLLHLLGWRCVYEGMPNEPKCIIIGVPHTSSWDFVISWLYYTSAGRAANVMVKKEFFFWPIGILMRKMGALPIDRSRGANIIRQTIQKIKENDYVHLAIAPEGTREHTVRWKAGFHMIARETGIPVYLGSFDWGRKVITTGERFELTDDVTADINRMKDYYRAKGIKGKHPELFCTDHQ